MRLFSLNEKPRRDVGRADTTHEWGLPGVECSACGCTWGTTGLEYPAIDLESLPNNGGYCDPWPVSVPLYQELERAIFNSFPQLNVLLPGAQFGASVGKAYGELDGFVWGAWWTTLMEEDALEKLRECDLLLPPTVEAELHFTNPRQSKRIFEFDLPLTARLANGIYDPDEVRLCSVCRRDSASMPARPVIQTDPSGTNPDIFRVANFTTLIVVSEKFVDAVSRLGIDGAAFGELDTVT